MNALNNILGTLALPWLDVAALLWLTVWWVGYVWYTDYRDSPQPTLRRQMDKFIRQWLARMVERDNRMLDVNVIRNLSRAAQFFASTTMLILGALVALMGYAEQAAGVIAELPFTQMVSERVWELKILLLILIFVYAFFKLSWSIRQYGMGTILVGATLKVPEDAEQYATHIDRTAKIISFAASNYNNGLRSYYFGMAALSWFLHPVLMIVVTLVVVYVLYQREFQSRTLQVLVAE